MKGCAIVTALLLCASCINVPHTYTPAGFRYNHPSENVSLMLSEKLGLPFYKCGMSRGDRFLMVNIGRNINPGNLSSFDIAEIYLNLHDKMTLSDVADDIYLCDTVPELLPEGFNENNSRSYFLDTGMDKDFMLPTMLVKTETIGLFTRNGEGFVEVLRDDELQSIPLL